MDSPPKAPDSEQPPEAVPCSALFLELRAENRRLRESQTFLRRIVAALVVEADGEMRVAERTMMLIPLDPIILTWSEPVARTLMIGVEKTKLQNDPSSPTAGESAQPNP